MNILQDKDNICCDMCMRLVCLSCDKGCKQSGIKMSNASLTTTANKQFCT